MVKQPDFISVPKAAEILGCSDVWVIRMIERGELEGFRLSGRAWAVSRASVAKNHEEYLKRDPALSGRKRSRA
jgi:excisionase family DNA binding protein